MTATTGMSGTARAYDAIDLSSRAFWFTTAAERERSFAELRAGRPVRWYLPVEDAATHDPDDRGYGRLPPLRHRRGEPQQRSVPVRQGGDVRKLPGGVTRSVAVLLAMDPPRHTKRRKLVSAAFTPRQVRRIEDSITTNAKTIVEELKAAGSGADFVEYCAQGTANPDAVGHGGILESERAGVAHAAEVAVLGDPEAMDGCIRRGAGREPGLPRRTCWRMPRSDANAPVMTCSAAGRAPRWT